MTLEKLLAEIRADGWRVAVHNDYRQDGYDFTFWLFTHVSGVWAKGEGKDDLTAVQNAGKQMHERFRTP